MSVTQSRFGPSAVKWRLTRSVIVFWVGTLLARRRSGSPEMPGPPHQQLHGVVADHEAVGALQLGMDPGLAVGAVGGVVDLPDQVGQPCMADRPGRRRPGLPVVVAGGWTRRARSRPGGRGLRQPGARPRGGAVFWGHHLLDRGSRLAEDLVLLLQVADLLPCRNELGGLGLAVPGLRPRSTRSCRFQRYRHDSAIPSSPATSATGRPERTRSSARCRNSGGYGLGIATTSPLRSSHILSTNCSGEPGHDHLT